MDMILVKNVIHVMGEVVRKAGLIVIAAVIRSRGAAAKQGFLMNYSKGDAIVDQGKCPL